MFSGEGARGEVGEAEGGGDAAGVAAVIGLDDRAFEEGVGNQEEVWGIDDGAWLPVVSDGVGFQGDLVAGDAAAVFNEAFGVDFNDGGFEVAAGGDRAVDGGLIAQEGGVARGGVEVAINDHLSCLKGSPVGVGSDCGE